MASVIHPVRTREILDSRGDPGVRNDVVLPLRECAP